MLSEWLLIYRCTLRAPSSHLCSSSIHARTIQCDKKQCSSTREERENNRKYSASWCCPEFPSMGNRSRISTLWGGLATYGERLAKHLAFPRLLTSKSHTPVGSMSPELPVDILMSIFATLEIPDLVRAGSVCSSWHYAYTGLCNLGLCKKSQTPCLLYTSESAGESVAGLYSLAEKKSYTLTLPDPPIRSRYVIGSNHGWIITADERSELHLVNPITGDQIALPSVTTIEGVKPIFDDAGAVHKYEYSRYGDLPPPKIYPLGVLRNRLFDKAFLSSDPSTGDYFVVLIHNPFSPLSFARAGDDKWTWLPPHGYYADCMFKDGLLYALTTFGQVRAFDLSGPAVTPNIVLGEVKLIVGLNMYIAQAPCGDMLQIWRRSSTTRRPTPGEPEDDEDGKDEDVSESVSDEDEDEDVSESVSDEDEDVSESVSDEDEDVSESVSDENEDVSESESDEDEDVWGPVDYTSMIDVFKLKPEPEPESDSDSVVHYTSMIEVFKVDFAANMIVGISSGDNVLFLGHNQTLCLSADAYPQLKSNHAYFTDDDGLYLSVFKKCRRDIGVLDLEDDTVEEIVSPQLWSNWPAPVWVIPNPRKMNSAPHG